MSGRASPPLVSGETAGPPVIAIASAFRPLRRCAACNSRPNSSAEAGRSAGSRAIALSIAEHTASGIPSARRFGTPVVLMRRYCAIRSSPFLRSWAALPAMSAKMVAPSEYMSAATVAGLPVITSGAV